MPTLYKDPSILLRALGTAPWPRIPSQSRVMLSPEMVAGLQTLALPRNRDLEAVKVLLHEFAHTRQPMTLNRPTFEGGAEAFAQQHLMDALRRLHIDRFDPTNSWPSYAYPQFTDRMRQSGWNAVNRGQFGRR